MHNQRNQKNSFKQKSTSKITQNYNDNIFENSNIKDLKNKNKLNESQNIHKKLKSKREYLNNNDLFINIAKFSKNLMSEGPSYDNYVSLAQSETSAGLLTRAEISWRSAILFNKNKDRSTAYIGLGQILLKTGKIEDTIRESSI